MNKLSLIFGNKYYLLVARIIVGFVFVMVSIGKISDPAHFAKEINNYNILPYMSVNFLAIIMPWIELICGLLIMFGVKLKANSFIIGSMLVVFIAAVASAWARGLNIDCGCYSNIAKQTVGLPKILENTGLIILTVSIWMFPKKEFTLLD